MLMELAGKDRRLLKQLLAAIEAMPPAAFPTADPVERVAAAAVDAEAVAELEAALAERDGRIAALEAAAEKRRRELQDVLNERESAVNELNVEVAELKVALAERRKKMRDMANDMADLRAQLVAALKAKPAVVGGMMDPPADPQQAGARKIMALQEEVRRLSDLVVRHGGKP